MAPTSSVVAMGDREFTINWHGEPLIDDRCGRPMTFKTALDDDHPIVDWVVGLDSCCDELENFKEFVIDERKKRKQRAKEKTLYAESTLLLLSGGVLAKVLCCPGGECGDCPRGPT